MKNDALEIHLIWLSIVIRKQDCELFFKNCHATFVTTFCRMFIAFRKLKLCYLKVQ